MVENIFGILTSRFGVFQKPIPLEPEKVEEVVLTSCALHNYLRSEPLSRNIYSPPEYFDRENMTVEFLLMQNGDNSQVAE